VSKKKESFSAATEWSNLLRKGEHFSKEASGQLYKVEPVDLETFVMSPDYLNQGMWGMSDSQRDFIEIGSDLDNGKTFFVMLVG
jgi:hypothetical protein